MLRDIDRFAFDEQTPLETRQAALDSFSPRPEPITVELPFTAYQAVERIGKYDQMRLISVMSPYIWGYTYPIDEDAREWAGKLQEHVDLSDEEQAKLLSGEVEPSNPDENEIVDLHSYADRLTLLGKTVTKQARETDFSLFTDEQRELAESESEERVFVSREDADFFASKGVYVPSGQVPKERLLLAHAMVNRRKRGVGNVAVTSAVEEIVRDAYDGFTKLLDYYNENGLIVPKRNSNYFNSLVWGLHRPSTEELVEYREKVKEAQDRNQEYVFHSFEGEADRERRDIVTYFGCIFGTRKQALKVAKWLLGSEHSHLEGDRI